MTAPATTPIAGPLFQRASKLPVGGPSRQKVIALLAAYADGGAEQLPRPHELAERLGLEPGKVVALADRLAEDGWLVRLPGRKRRYALGAWSA